MYRDKVEDSAAFTFDREMDILLEKRNLETHCALESTCPGQRGEHTGVNDWDSEHDAPRSAIVALEFWNSGIPGPVSVFQRDVPKLGR